MKSCIRRNAAQNRKAISMRAITTLFVAAFLLSFAATAVADCVPNTTPSVNASVSGPDVQGNWTFTISWTMYNTDPNATGNVSLGNSRITVYSNNQAPLSGSATRTVSLLCWSG